MNVDHFFEIGNSHVRDGSPCEDYSASGIINFDGKEHAYAIVSDGCSGAENTDFGSRILTAHTESILKYGDYLKCEGDCKSLEDRHFSMGDEIIELSKLSANTLPEGYDQCLFSTLLVAVSDGENHFVNVYGDGDFILQKEDVKILYSVDYYSNTPYYLCYESCKLSHEAYVRDLGDSEKTLTITVFDDDEIISREVKTFKFNQPICFKFSGKYKTISVASDGIHTFKTCGSNDFQKSTSIADKVTSFKNFKGSFLRRRYFNGMGKEFKKENIIHEDDFSVSTIHFDEE